ncbi:MAG: hypothetical protein GXO47_12820 [Chlorobi bacterium]|nr:hypothetical protein [Chlorobiota bacterium]
MKDLLKGNEFESHYDEMEELKGISVKDIFTGRLVTRKFFRKQMLFVFYLAVLGFFYIMNHHEVERMQKELHSLNEEVKELRFEAVTTSSELMSMSKPSEVLRRMKKMGVEMEELKEPPRILYVSK